MTVAIGSELSIETGPAASAGGAGSSGSVGGVLPGAGSPSAENFRTRWQSELAALRSAGQDDGLGDDGDAQMAAESAGVATSQETKFAPPAAFASVNVQSGRQAAGVSGSLSALATRNPAGNSAIGANDNAPPESGPARSAESQSAGSKDTQNSREARKRDDAHGRSKADSLKDAASTSTSMEMVPLVVAQQQIQIPALAAGAGTSMPTPPFPGKTDGTNRKMAVESGSSASAHPNRAVQSRQGIAPNGTASAAGVRPAGVTGGDSGESMVGDGGEDGVHGPVTGDHVVGSHAESLLGGGSGDSGQKTALLAAAGQGIQAADAHTAENTAQASAGDATGSQGAAAAASASVSDSGRESVSTSRPGRSSNAVPGVGQNAGQDAGESSAAQGREGSVAITPAAGVAVTHGMPSQPAGASAAAPGSGSGNGSEKGAGETFAAMDAQANGSGLTWVHAGAHQAEAGFQDPALGWVAVRAGMGAGGVHAAIVPGTAEAAQTLGGHMAGLSAHLAEQRVGVSSVSMNNPGNSLGVAPQLAGGGAGQNGRHSNGGPGQNQGQQTSSSYAVPAVASTSAARESARFDSGTQGGAVAGASGMRGRNISVVA